jgi:small nuclear ribonucleoprotein (snRNP)-like protein
VRALKTSREIWGKLKAIYQQMNVATQVISYTKLIEIHMVENANVIEFLDEFLDLLLMML